MNTSSLSQTSCPKCGTTLSSAETAGLCPRCLMAEAMIPSQTGAEPTGTRPMLTPEELAPHFPQLEILECLGRGGMGVVYKARQKSLNRVVALKLLAPERGNDAGFAQRFQKEAQALAKLNHPAIVTVYDFGLAGGFYFLLMEFVDGMNLRQLLQAGRIEAREALAIVPQICDALQYAHDAGIVHRDIKPENILLDRRGHVKVADFGLAKIIHCPESSDLSDAADTHSSYPETTEASKVVGTPQYMAPEQTEHPASVDHRADIYSLGVVFYQMLTGELPKGDFVPPSKRVVMDVRLDEVVLRALEKRPELRYQQVSDVKTMVESIVATPQPPQTEELAARACESLYATPEYLATTWGSMKLHEGMATLGLYSDRLVIGRGWQTTTIPFHAVRKLNVVKYPRCLSLKGLHSILVEYEEAGKLQRILLTPRRGGSFFSLSIGLFSSVTETNQCVYEWFMTIRKAITATKGQPPDGSATPELYQNLSNEGLLWAKLSLVMSGLLGLPVLAFLILTGTRLLRHPGPELIYIPSIVIGMGITFLIARSQRKQWQRNNPLPATMKQPLAGAASLSTAASADIPAVSPQSLFSGTAVLGAFFAVLCLSAMFLQVKLFGIAATAVVTTLLGWIAVSQIRRSAGKLYGLWLAVFDGLLFPLLAVNGALILPIMRFLQQEKGLGMIPFWLMLLIGLGIMAIITSNVFIIRRVWRAVNKPFDGADSSANIPSPIPPRKNSTAKLIGIGCLVVALMGFVFVILSAGAFFWFRHSKMDSKRQRLHELQANTFTLQEFDWHDGEAERRPLSGVLVTMDGTLALKIENTRNAPLLAPILKRDWPAITVTQYAITGEVKYENVQGTGYLEMWSHFSQAGKYFSRTLDASGSGPMAVIGGTSDWRAFSLPFDRSGATNAVSKLEMNLDLPAKGVVYLRSIKLVQSGGTQPQPQSVFDLQPVLELTLPLDKDGLTDMFDPETGKIVPSPNPYGTSQGSARSTQKGLLIKYDSQVHKTELVGLNGVMTQESRADQWDEITNLQALETLRGNTMSSGGSVGAMVSGKGLHTFLFKTGSNKIGLLQITGYTENPHGLKIRYKLVQPSKFIRQPGTYPLSDGGIVVLTPSSDGRVSLAVTMVEGTSRDTLSIPDFCKKEGWFVYIESPARFWIFDGIRQLDVVVQDGRYWVGDLGVHALCPKAVWDAVPESVRKLYREPQANEASGNTGIPQKLFFGPVVERTIYDYKSGKEWLLNLKTGETFSLPPGLDWDRNASAVWQWAHDHGVHVTGLPVVSQRGLYGFKMKVALLRKKGALFETVSADVITNALKGNLVSVSTHNGGPPLYQLWGNDWQSLFAFETDQGVLGVLQVTGFTENPLGVKIRYKLVQGAKTNPNTMPISTVMLAEPTNQAVVNDITQKKIDVSR